MDSIYDKLANEKLIKRIHDLTPEAQAKWGKMTVNQMLKHCVAPIDVAFGTKKLKINFLMKLLGRMIKNSVINNDFKRNMPTAPEFVFADEYDFDVAKEELIEKISRFSEQGTKVIQVLNHPFWGKMTYTDWDKLLWRHTDHHLRQFGV